MNRSTKATTWPETVGERSGKHDWAQKTDAPKPDAQIHFWHCTRDTDPSPLPETLHGRFGQTTYHPYGNAKTLDPLTQSASRHVGWPAHQLVPHLQTSAGEPLHRPKHVTRTTSPTPFELVGNCVGLWPSKSPGTSPSPACSSGGMGCVKTFDSNSLNGLCWKSKIQRQPTAKMPSARPVECKELTQGTPW